MKRYAIMTYNGVSKMCEAPDGQYVKHEDVKPNDNLRDQFAMAAITGTLPGAAIGDERVKEYAQWAYKMADAMLEARNARVT